MSIVTWRGEGEIPPLFEWASRPSPFRAFSAVTAEGVPVGEVGYGAKGVPGGDPAW